jgi:hypothetical protein
LEIGKNLFNGSPGCRFLFGEVFDLQKWICLPLKRSDDRPLLHNSSAIGSSLESTLAKVPENM